MTPLPAPHAHAGLVLHWQLKKGRRRLACGLTARRSGEFDVVASASDADDSGISERFDNVGDALLRHAAITSALREAGWQVTDHSPTRTAMLS
jgi:hypothetical protein